MTLEELKKEFTDQGFHIDGDSFVHEFEDPNTIINGQHPMKRFEMTYVCEGWMKDAGDSDDGEPIYQFDVLGQGRKPVVTICISNFDDFTKLVQ
jgi:hypothetical protein